MHDNYGLIGAGALGSYLVAHLIGRNFTINIRSEEKKEIFFQRVAEYTSSEPENIMIVTSNSAVAQVPNLTALFICVPPSQVQEVCQEIADIVHPDTPVICLAAKIKLRLLQQWLPRSNSVSRVMTTIQFSPLCVYSENPTAVRTVDRFFSPKSEVFPSISDEEIDAVTLVSGCGYALYSWFITEILAGVPATVDRDQLIRIIGSTLCTLGDDLQHNNASGVGRLNDIISDVACHGGLTERMILKFRHDGLNLSIKDAAGNAMSVMNQD